MGTYIIYYMVLFFKPAGFGPAQFVYFYEAFSFARHGRIWDHVLSIHDLWGIFEL